MEVIINTTKKQWIYSLLKSAIFSTCNKSTQVIISNLNSLSECVDGSLHFFKTVLDFIFNPGRESEAEEGGGGGGGGW